VASDLLTTWRKSSYSDTATNCVEVAPVPSGTAVRDSKNPTDGFLTVRTREWTAFIDTVKSGRFDLN